MAPSKGQNGKHCGHGICAPSFPCIAEKDTDGTLGCFVAKARLPVAPLSGKGQPPIDANTAYQNQCLRGVVKPDTFISCDNMYHAGFEFQGGKCYATCDAKKIDNFMLWVLIAVIGGGCLALLAIFFTVMN
jgi:hypothetical protein